MPPTTHPAPVCSSLPSRRALLDAAAARLAAAGIEAPRREARLLLAAALGLTQSALLLDRDAPADPALLEPALARRVAREPLALILRRREFWGLEFEVSPATLVPRPDSETLIEAALAAWPQRDANRVLDLGTGTGCLLLAALSELPAAWGIGIDAAPAAACLAARNAARLGLSGRTAFLAGDWAASLAGRFDLILCNPPYICTDEIPELVPEVASHEPARALDGGVDGLDAYRRIVSDLPRLLAAGGVALLELGAGQAAAVAALAVAACLVPAPPRADLAGIPRALPLRLG